MNLPLGPEHLPSASYYVPLALPCSRPGSRASREFCLQPRPGTLLICLLLLLCSSSIPAGISPPCPPPSLPFWLAGGDLALRWHGPRCRWVKATLGTGSRERQPEPSLPRTANSLGRSKSETAQAREARDRRGHAVSPSCPRAVPAIPVSQSSGAKLQSEVMENSMGMEVEAARCSGSLLLPPAAPPALGMELPPCFPRASPARSPALPPARPAGILQLELLPGAAPNAPPSPEVKAASCWRRRLLPGRCSGGC